MFTAFISIFKTTESEPDIDLAEANKALQERMVHVLRHPHLAPRATPKETYSTALLKTRIPRREMIII